MGNSGVRFSFVDTSPDPLLPLKLGSPCSISWPALQWCLVASGRAPHLPRTFLKCFLGRLFNSPVSAYAESQCCLAQPGMSRSEGGLAYCVRLCDGRYFPIQHHGGASRGAGLQLVFLFGERNQYLQRQQH